MFNSSVYRTFNISCFLAVRLLLLSERRYFQEILALMPAIRTLFYFALLVFSFPPLTWARQYFWRCSGWSRHETLRQWTLLSGIWFNCAPCHEFERGLRKCCCFPRSLPAQKIGRPLVTSAYLRACRCSVSSVLLSLAAEYLSKKDSVELSRFKLKRMFRGNRVAGL